MVPPPLAQPMTPSSAYITTLPNPIASPLGYQATQLELESNDEVGIWNDIYVSSSPAPGFHLGQQQQAMTHFIDLSTFSSTSPIPRLAAPPPVTLEQLTPPPPRHSCKPQQHLQISSQPRTQSKPVTFVPENSPSKYDQLLAKLQEIDMDIRPSYAGSKTSLERLKRSIAHARILVKEALTESDSKNWHD